MTDPRATVVSPHLTGRVAHRMFTRPWQRYAWAAVPLLTMGVLTGLPFLVAWRRRVVGWPVAAAYTTAGAVVLGFAMVQPEVNGWFAVAVWALMITAIVHVLRLEPAKAHGK